MLVTVDGCSYAQAIHQRRWWMVSRETLVEGNHVKVSDMYQHLVAHPEPFRGRERSVPAQSASCPKYWRVLSESAIGCSAGQSSQNVRLGRQIIIIRTQYLIYVTSELQVGKKLKKHSRCLDINLGAILTVWEGRGLGTVPELRTIKSGTSGKD